ncbi:MAG: rubredoxin-like domain-containing protein [Promethearchaeia archaeon]
MTRLLKCRVCGFIISENQLKGDLCPACGVPRKNFEKFDSNISNKRRKLLDLHIHPIVLHFPQAFSIMVFFLSFLHLVFPAFFSDLILYTLPLLSLFLPFFVGLAMISGMFDGKLRFKSITTPYLKLKIIIGVIFILCSIMVAIFSFLIQTLGIALLLTVIFSFVCVLMGGINGYIGGQLICAKIPDV